MIKTKLNNLDVYHSSSIIISEEKKITFEFENSLLFEKMIINFKTDDLSFDNLKNYNFAKMENKILTIDIFEKTYIGFNKNTPIGWLENRELFFNYYIVKLPSSENLLFHYTFLLGKDFNYINIKENGE